MKTCERCEKTFPRKEIVAVRGTGLMWFVPVWLCKPCYELMKEKVSKQIDKYCEENGINPEEFQ